MRIRIEDLGAVRRVTIHGPVQSMGRVLPSAQFDSPYSKSLLESFVAQRKEHFLNEYERFADPHFVKGRLQRCLARIGCDPSNTRSVLDFGCGTGTISLILAETGFRHVTGVDINEESIALARRRALEQGFLQDGRPDAPPAHLKFEAIAPRDTSFGEAAYDLVIMNAVLEHLTPAERSELLPALWRALRPGGHLLIHETPNRLFPIDRHTTDLVGLPWLPIGLKHLYARLCRRLPANLGTVGLFRSGIHGATIFEIRRLLPTGEVEDRSHVQDPRHRELTATDRARGGAEELLIILFRAGLLLIRPALAKFGFATVHLYPFLLVCLRKRQSPEVNRQAGAARRARPTAPHGTGSRHARQADQGALRR